SSLTIEGIGKASLIPENLDEPTIFECHIIKIKLNVDKLNPEFFRVLSETPFFRAQIMKNSKTATMTTISQDGIMNNTVLLPPITIQLKFAQIAKKTLAINKNQSECKIGSDNLFNSMMQKAFKGELV
ncbi:MAG: hypothetical protein Q7R33_06370, partial [Nitrosarchaeum sp.]|nr:hypothetical protein [Nitrosarchaeum sp.]